MSIYNALVMAFNKLRFSIYNVKDFHIYKVTIKNGDKTLSIQNYIIAQNTIEIILKETIDIKKECFIYYESFFIKANFKYLYTSPSFNEKYYTDCKLGITYSLKSTTFKLWTPVATYINLLLYKNGDISIEEKPRKFKMYEKSGLWSVVISGDLKGYFYTYEVKIFNDVNEVVDPYAKAVGINGLRAAIIDLKETNPEDFCNDVSKPLENYTDAIIYEMNIRDISIHPDSGVINKGKFLALTEDNSYSNKGVSTVLNHIKELGVTHLQIMPFFDFSFESVDERNITKYNWGYDPQNYNVPEGSYSTNPYDPICRIYELKKMIYHLHKNDLSVVMDVVFNHCFGENNNFEKIFPGYYFRLYDDGSFVKGSGCENDTASEHLMVKKFIIDSVLYWATEYHIDGFRFDLMGIHDVDTMNEIRTDLYKINPSIIIYGEGWDLNTNLNKDLKACQYNSNKMPYIAHFNDTIRDSIKGSIFNPYDKGFINGREGLEEIIKRAVSGSIFENPYQSINYVCAHDNNTLWDKLEYTNKQDNIEDKKAMQKLANGIILTSQGIPFLHSGVEFCRTKKGVENSYNYPDEINRIDWDRKFEFLDVFNYYKGLIKLRKEHPIFRLMSKESINSYLEFLSITPKNTVAFTLRHCSNIDSWTNILVVYNANKNSVKLSIPVDNWYQVVDKYKAGVEPIRIINNGTIEVLGISMCVLFAL